MSKLEYKRDPGRAMMSAFAHCPSEKSHPEKMAWIAEYFLIEVIGTQAAANKAEVEKAAAWIDQFGNVWPLGAYSPTGKPNYLDADKRGWKPLFRSICAETTGLIDNFEQAFFVVQDAEGNPDFVTRTNAEAQEHINDACEMGVEGAGKWKSIPVFKMVELEPIQTMASGNAATPPATTGASTVDLRNDEVFDELLGDYGDSFGKLTGNIDPEPIYQYIEQAYAKVGASTVLTDERKPIGYARFRAAQRITTEGDVDANEWYEFCEPHDIGDDKLPAFPVYDEPVREVAAQTGQVAVPEGFAIVPLEPTDEMINAFYGALASVACSYFDWEDGGDEAYAAMLAAAPSPAKESK